MKNFISTILLCFALLEVHGQVNLVPNFSFEEYTDCPLLDGQSYFASGWSKFSTQGSTPDYYNKCSETTEFGIPQSFICYQEDNRGCNAYIGLGTIVSSSFDREYVGTEINEPLVVGQKYFLSFYTVMGEYVINGNQYGMPSNNIGMLLSTISFSESNPTPTNNFSHLRSESIITDSVNWMRVSGSIVADSSYQYVVLGNFYNDLYTDTIHYNCLDCMNQASYYLIDDICISTDSLLCNGGIELLSCNLSVDKKKIENQISIFPNPVNDYVNISNINNQFPIDISICNMMGQQLYFKKNISTSEIKIDVSQFNSALLFIEIKFNNQTYNYRLLKR